MTAMEWLKSKARRYAQLSADEHEAITSFSLLWSLFENRVLDTNCSSNKICATVASWSEGGTLDADQFSEQLAYFRNRYFRDGDFTHHFHQLHLRPKSDHVALVKAVVRGDENDAISRMSAMLIIIYRYRNNLFHGMKWQYDLAGQFENFTAANTILIKLLEKHGRLRE